MDSPSKTLPNSVVRIVAMDVDDTLLRGRSQVFYLRDLTTAGLLPISITLRAAWWSLMSRHGWGDPDPTAQHNFVMSHLRTNSFDQLAELCRKTVENVLVSRLRPEGVAAIRHWQSQGAIVVLVSAAVDTIIEPLREFLGADAAICTRLVRSDGLFPGRIDGRMVIGPVKWEMLQTYANTRFTDWRLIAAYGDSEGDLDLLCNADSPIAVRPSRSLLKIARRRGWQVLTWD